MKFKFAILLTLISSLYSNPILDAIKSSNYDQARSLLNDAVTTNLNFIDKHGNTLLHYAAMINDPEVALKLLGKGFDVNATNNYAFTPLAVATQNMDFECLEVVNTLLAYNSDLETTDNDGYTALHNAVLYGYMHIVQALVNAGANTNALTSDEETPLHLALNNEYIDVASELIENGADVNIVSDTGLAPLHLAITIYPNLEGPEKDIVKALINAGANVDAPDDEDETPLIMATRQGFADLVELLIYNNADVNAQDIIGNTALHYADDPNIAQLLIDQGVNINQTNSNRSTALHYAAESGNIEMILFLYARGADTSIANHDNKTPEVEEYILESEI